MATDNSPPRIRLILTLAVGTVVTLFVLKFVFDSYFTEMMEREAKAKVAQPVELWKLREEESKKLSGGPLPIDKAISELSSKGREASPLIAPQPSSDEQPITGWSQGTRALAAKAAGGEAKKSEPAAVGDAGATTTTTTTAAAAAAGDGGALPHPNPPPKGEGAQH
ncbi:MAG TPA: hypothetical protein VNO21_27825 [Polyangiaceae bacterium]|nr:hypothetical protein [Polyangiaceae bacterium]